MKTPLAGAALALTALAAAPPVAAQPAAWTGTYEYNEALGRDALGQGLAIFVDHRLTLKPKSCRLTALGFQTNTTIRCAAKANGPRLDVTFVSFGDDALTSQYSVGQRLLSLRRQGGGVVTTWGAYTPQMDAHNKPGVYFKPVR